jgi:hypothetical protein
LSVQIRPGVTLQYAATNSHAACVSRGLDPTLMDDRLLACALQFRDNHTDGDVVVVTQDAHFEFKARHHGLQTMMPADPDVLEELDPAEKENRELRRQAQLLQSRLPRLQVGFSDGTSHVKLQLEPLQDESPDSVQAEMAETRLKYPKAEWPERPPITEAEEPLNLDEALSGTSVFTIPLHRSNQEIVEIQGRQFALTKEEVRAYNSRVEKYYNQVRDWCIESLKFDNRTRWAFSLQFRVINSGTVPAHNVRIILSIPLFFSVTEECPLGSPPKKPSPPELPETSALGSLSHAFSSLYSSDLFRNHLSADFSNLFDESRPHVVPTDVGHEVRFHLSKLAHDDRGKELGPVWIAFPPGSDPRSFQIPCTIYSDDLPEKIDQVLHVVIGQADFTR